MPSAREMIGKKMVWNGMCVSIQLPFNLQLFPVKLNWMLVQRPFYRSENVLVRTVYRLYTVDSVLCIIIFPTDEIYVQTSFCPGIAGLLGPTTILIMVAMAHFVKLKMQMSHTHISPKRIVTFTL